MRLTGLAWIPMALAIVSVSCGSTVTVDQADGRACNNQSLQRCDDRCVDLQSDDAHCGSCDNGCGPQQGCQSGVCVIDPCPPEQARCDGECVWLATDPAYCGSCAVSCAPGESCSKGACVASCDEGLQDCDGSCVDPTTDLQNCGGCGVMCDPDQSCTGGMCQGCEPWCGFCEVGELGPAVPSTTSGSTAGLADAFAPSCAPSSSPDQAFRFVAPFAGMYTFDTFPASFDTVLSVLAACVELSCNDNTPSPGGALSSSIDMFLQAGQEVMLVVGGVGAEQGDYTLEVSAADPMECDATPLSPLTPQVVSGNTTTSTDEFSGSCNGGGTAPDDVYSFTAPAAGTYVFSTNGSPFDTVLYVRNGICEGPELGCDDDGGAGLNSLLSVALSAGQTVYVFVDGFGQSQGPYTLQVESP